MFSTNPVDGTSYYRGWGPWSRVPGVTLIPYVGQKEWQDLIGFDACVVQRPTSQFHVTVIETLKSNKIPVIVDYDDDVFNVPEENQVADHYKRDEIIAALKACFMLADVVTVSTPALRDSIIEHCPNAAPILVLPNAVDDKRFAFRKTHKREKSVLIRGASSHGKDWGQYKDVLIEWFNSNPDWTLQVMGWTPHWMNQIKNLKAYEFLDIARYFELLETLNPSLMLVPLEDTKFNKSKSNIAQLEGLIAGAPCLASDLPEFAAAETFVDAADLKNALDCILTQNASPEYIDMLYRTQLRFAPLLSQVNEERLDILENIKSKRRIRPVATDLEFHEYALSHGYSNDFPDYSGLTDKLTKWIIETFNPRFTMELGAGNGSLLHKLLLKGIVAYGLEINPYEAKYFHERYPMFAHALTIGDITTEPIEQNEPGDLLISTEVFEHIDKPDEWFVEYLSDLATKYRNFYFTSTPFHYIPEFDNMWGHKNIKLQSQWKAIFEKAGWIFVSNPKILTGWDMVFKSTKL